MLVRLTSRIMDRGVERLVGDLVEVDAESTWIARGLAVEVAAEPVNPVAAAAPVVAPADEPAPALAPAPESEPIAIASPPPAPPRRRGRHTE